MSTRTAQPAPRKPFPTWVIVVTIIIIIIITIALIATWISLQECIKDSRNNVCHNGQGNVVVPATCCADTANCEEKFPPIDGKPQGYTCVQGTCCPDCEANFPGQNYTCVSGSCVPPVTPATAAT